MWQSGDLWAARCWRHDGVYFDVAAVQWQKRSYGPRRTGRNLARAAEECFTCPLCRMAKGSRTKHVRREGERPLQPWRYLTLALWRCIDKNELKIARSPTLGKSSTQRPRSYHIQSTIWAIFSISTILSTAQLTALCQKSGALLPHQERRGSPDDIVTQDSH